MKIPRIKNSGGKIMKISSLGKEMFFIPGKKHKYFQYENIHEIGPTFSKKSKEQEDNSDIETRCSESCS